MWVALLSRTFRGKVVGRGDDGRAKGSWVSTNGVAGVSEPRYSCATMGQFPIRAAVLTVDQWAVPDCTTRAHSRVSGLIVDIAEARIWVASTARMKEERYRRT
jgi:hypothetical protein